jgi:phage tail tape-measure protein
LFNEQEMDKGLELVTNGTQRLAEALEYTRGKDRRLQKQYEAERRGWDLYYDILDVVEQAIQNKDPFALQLQQKAKAIINDCKVGGKGQRALEDCGWEAWRRGGWKANEH